MRERVTRGLEVCRWRRKRRGEARVWAEGGGGEGFRWRGRAWLFGSGELVSWRSVSWWVKGCCLFKYQWFRPLDSWVVVCLDSGEGWRRLNDLCEEVVRVKEWCSGRTRFH